MSVYNTESWFSIDTCYKFTLFTNNVDIEEWYVLMLTSKNELFCSVSTVNVMLIWRELKQLWNRFTWSDDLKSTIISSTYYIISYHTRSSVESKKSLKLISACNIEWRNSSFFNNTLIIDFFWRIFSCNKLNWHCWYVLEDFKDLVATQKFKNFRITELLLQLTKIYKVDLSFPQPVVKFFELFNCVLNWVLLMFVHYFQDIMIRFSRRKVPFNKRNTKTYSKIRNRNMIPRNI